MKHILILISGLLTTQLFAERKLVDRVAAVVNGEIILHSDIQGKIDSEYPIIVSSFPAPQTSSKYEQALQDSINYELINQEADRLNIGFDDAEVEAEISKTLKSRGLELGAMMEELRQQGISYADYKEFYLQRMVISRFQQAVIRPLVKITQKDLETYYLKRTGQKSSNVKVTISQLRIDVGGTADSQIAEGKKKLANKVYRDLQGGLSFTEAVKIYSDDTSARENGGNMGSVGLKDLATPIRKAIEGLSPGEFSRPIFVGSSYYIFKLEDKQFAGSSEFQQVRVKLENELAMTQMNRQTQKWLAERRQRSEVKVLK